MPKEVITPKIAPTVPPKRSIQAVAFSPKVQLIATARYGEVELVNPVNQVTVRKLTGFTGKVNAVAFSPDGETVYAAGGEAGIVGIVRSWKTSDGTALRSFEGHTDAAYALAVSPDGKFIATGAYDQKIRLWDTATGKEVALLKGHNGAVNGLSFRPDGKVLASASADRTVKLWSIPNGSGSTRSRSRRRSRRASSSAPMAKRFSPPVATTASACGRSAPRRRKARTRSSPAASRMKAAC
jgi:WD40 repeat protein